MWLGAVVVAVLNDNNIMVMFLKRVIFRGTKWCIHVVQSPINVRFFVTPWTAARQASQPPTISWSLPRFKSNALVMASSHLILWRPLLLLPSIIPSIRVFSSELALGIRWPKYWSFSFSISPSNEYSGLISFKIDWFDLLAVQRTFKSLLQYHSWKTAILQHSALFMVEFSQPYVTTRKALLCGPLSAKWCLWFSTHYLGFL